MNGRSKTTNPALKITSPPPGVTARAQLIASGRLIPASGPLVLPPRARVPLDSGDVLQELREER
jgi:hypothetical protein